MKSDTYTVVIGDRTYTYAKSKRQCQDCEKTISHDALRCTSCAQKFRRQYEGTDERVERRPIADGRLYPVDHGLRTQLGIMRAKRRRELLLDRRQANC